MQSLCCIILSYFNAILVYTTTENNLENDSSCMFSLINSVAFNGANQLVYMQEKNMQQASKPLGEA